jgi:alpha-L-fucosidase
MRWIALFVVVFLSASLLRAAPPEGPFQENWDTLKDHYKVPQWFTDGKFGIFMHWGLYAVPAHGSEWYVRYMYGGNQGVTNWHIQHFGPLDKFGYKDFIPKFTAAKWDPDAWAELFRKAGAKYVVPTAEHHDGFSLWDSALNKYNAAKMGPKRDLIGDLAKAVRAKGLKFGVSNHSMEHFGFIPYNANSDQVDPEWAEFYHTADRSDAERERFNDLWVKKNWELIDKYQPDMLWFDNGLNGRGYDKVKLQVAAYYYNRATEWGKEVSLSTKSTAYLYGSIRDYERQGRIIPREIKNFAWQVDDPIGEKFGYNTDVKGYKPAALLIRRIADTVSMGGNYLLNLSPDAEGVIDQDQQDRLLAIGKWLDVNGEAIYGTRPWTRYGEGPYYDAPAADQRGADNPPAEAYSAKEIRFTTKGDTLYAIVTDWPGEQAVITSLATGKAEGKVTRVELLGHSGDLKFTQDAEGLKVKFPAEKPCDAAYALKITGVKTH